MALAALALLRRVADTAIHGTARRRPERYHHRLLAAPAGGRMLPVADAGTLIAGFFGNLKMSIISIKLIFFLVL